MRTGAIKIKTPIPLKMKTFLGKMTPAHFFPKKYNRRYLVRKQIAIRHFLVRTLMLEYPMKTLMLHLTRLMRLMNCPKTR